jgi:hypothetical protein
MRQLADDQQRKRPGADFIPGAFIFYDDLVGLRLNRLGQFCQAGHFAGCCTFVQNTFFGRFIDGGLGYLEMIGGFRGIVCGGLANIFDEGLHAGLDRPVAHTPNVVLAGAFEG